jgi:outer membrane protein OmpA-like peptidoglycan-associated protein
MKKAILFLFFAQLFGFSYAQEYKLLSLTAFGGTAIMQGDGTNGDLRAAGGVGLKYSLANNFAVRLQVMGGQMLSKNLGDSVKSLYASTSTFYDINFQAMLNLVNFKKMSTGKNVAQFYVGTGLGYAVSNLEYKLGIVGKESIQTLVIPFTAGFRAYLNPSFDLGFEYSVRGTFTDNFEGYSPNSTTNKALDFYSVPQLFLTYHFGKNKKARCLEWTEPTEKLYEELIQAKKEAQEQIEAVKKENQRLNDEIRKEQEKQVLESRRKTDSLINAVRESFKNDGDGDGVSDVFDKELNTPKGATIDGSGKMLDSDKDSVPDYLDKCPTIPGRTYNNGCPIQANKAQLAIISDGIKNLQFETGSSVIISSSFPALNNVAQMIVENSSFIFRIEGHTDNVGEPDKNMVLSMDRAQAVKNYLISRGVPAERIIAIGYGDSKPVVSNETAAGRAKNRRVDMNVE